MKHIKSMTMLDGVQLGLNLQLEANELQQCRHVLTAAGAIQKDAKTLEINVSDNRGQLVLAVRQHLHDKTRWFLNMSGNPLTFYTGQNVIGFAEKCDTMIVCAYKRVMSIVEDLAELKFPQRLSDELTKRNVNINYIEFATYTTKVDDVKQLLADWHHMYDASYSSNGRANTSVSELLNVRHERLHISHTSVALKIMGSDRRGIDSMLMAYNKSEELQSKAGTIDTNAVHAFLIKDRIRVELSLQSEWFKRKKIAGRKLQTLAQLDQYVKQRHTTWPAFIDYEFAKAVERCCLFSMWTVERSTSAAASAFAYQRQIMHATDDERHDKKIVFDSSRALEHSRTRLLSYTESQQLVEHKWPSE